ncbi:MAG: glutamate-5-semialdehyde dehydrogenase [Fusobacteriaceae bacterium]|jgi:glutamate-5-semialdehyde dehydrogenase|nr:glutamate-5-semialdehyde dehydrogenase [Fusobacteriaceae bacterium]
MMDLNLIGKSSKIAAMELAKLSTKVKNFVLVKSAQDLIRNSQKILDINKKDVEEAIKNKVKDAFIDRLTLTEARIESMANGLIQVASLNDPVGEYIFTKTLPNGLIVGQKRVPLGVIAIIFESRPNVTVDAFGLCLKSGNASILRGGKEAINTNKTIVEILRTSLSENKLNPDIVQIITDTSHETADKLLKLNKYIDVLIPRGGANLINNVIENSTIPCIQTGLGNCHIYIDESGDLNKAVDIIINAKTQRPGVCNSVEKLLIHEKIASKFLPIIGNALREKNVEIRGDKEVLKYVKDAKLATEIDWHTEYEDYIIGIKVLKDLDEAINHINEYGTKHSEAIITENYTNSQKFLNEIDAAAVYVNASTRFTDGEQFGFGAEIGISTQKLHARGPMGLKELTSTKYIIYGNGQIRE